MHCTACNSGKLIYGYVEGDLPNYQCSSCEGRWIKIDAYLHWLSRSNHVNDVASNDDDFVVVDTKKVLICPETGSLMLKFKVSNQLDCHIDYSSVCAGIWLDAGEWELLKQSGLLGQLNQIATDTWQSRMRKERAEQVFEDKYEKLFGEDNHQRLKELKQWLDQQDKKREMLAYLSSKNPYGVY